MDFQIDMVQTKKMIKQINHFFLYLFWAVKWSRKTF